MNIRRQRKDRMRYAPRYRRSAPYRKDGMFYEDYCCQSCFWDWGVGFGAQPLHNHDSGESNYNGALKKYWRSSYIDYFKDVEDDTN